MKLRVLILSVLVFGAVGFKYKDSFQAMGLKFAAPTIFGKGNVYGPEAGEIVYDSSDSKFYGRDHGSNWVPLSAGESILPTGVILPFGGIQAPNGFKMADGSTLLKADYPQLYDAIKGAFGETETTFNLPDMRGRFMRGVDGSANNDPDHAGRLQMATGGNSGNNVGSVQLDQFKSHDHQIPRPFNGSWSGGASVGGGDRSGEDYARIRTDFQGGSETRPKNVYVNYIIKL